MKRLIFTAAVAIAAIAAIAATAQTANAQLFRLGFGWRCCGAQRYAANCRARACFSGSCPSTTNACATGSCGAAPAACAPTSATPTCTSGSCTFRQPTCEGGLCAAEEYKPTCNADGERTLEPYTPAESQGKECTVCALLQRINAVRTQYGLGALIENSALKAGAYNQSVFCARIGYLQHAGNAYEILAQNYQRRDLAIDTAISQWLASPGHRNLLLNRGFRYAGVAVYRDAYGRNWCAVQFR